MEAKPVKGTVRRSAAVAGSGRGELRTGRNFLTAVAAGGVTDFWWVARRISVALVTGLGIRFVAAVHGVGSRRRSRPIQEVTCELLPPNDFLNLVIGESEKPRVGHTIIKIESSSYLNFSVAVMAKQKERLPAQAPDRRRWTDA